MENSRVREGGARTCLRRRATFRGRTIKWWRFDAHAPFQSLRTDGLAPLYFPDHFPARRELEELTAATAAVTLKIARRAATIRERAPRGLVVEDECAWWLPLSSVDSVTAPTLKKASGPTTCLNYELGGLSGLLPPLQPFGNPGAP